MKLQPTELQPRSDRTDSRPLRSEIELTESKPLDPLAPSEILGPSIGADPLAIDHAAAFIFWLLGFRPECPGGPPSICRPLTRDQLERVWEGLTEDFVLILWDAYEAEL